ncbi:MAG: Ig-like domain-containing protein, partial [Oscillatoria sp. PMC 1050.18]|nr:Ig-like domain-containing protein [Oscillatoria sp. PMC 1050.18]
NVSGSSLITIRATDTGDEFVETTFNVTVSEETTNTPPTATEIQDVNVVANSPAQIISLFEAFDDAEDLDTELVYTVENNTNTTLFASEPSIDANTGNLTLEFAENVSGSSLITIRATDTGDEFVETTFNVTVSEDSTNNNAPVASDDSVETSVNFPRVILVETLLANDSDPNGDPLTITSLGNAVNGTVGFDNNLDALFTPNPGFVGQASFVYTVSDGTGGTDTATVNVNVLPNETPVAVDDNITASQDTPITIPAANLLANDTDADGDTLTVTAVSNPTRGTVTLNNGNVVYTPAPGFRGEARFDYTISDGKGARDTGRVNVTVTAGEPIPPGLSANDDNIFSIGGSPTTEFGMKLTLAGVDAAIANEVGLVQVNADNEIISGTERVVFSALNSDAQEFLSEQEFTSEDLSRVLRGFNGGSRFVFYLVPNSTTDSVGEISLSNDQIIFGSTFGASEAFEQLQVTDEGEGVFELSFEDIVDGEEEGELYGDLVLNVELTEEEAIASELQGSREGELLDLRDFTGQVTANIAATGDAGFNNRGGLYLLENREGAVLDNVGNTILPGEEGYREAALAQSVVEFDNIDPDALQLEGGEIYAPYLLADGDSTQAYFPFIDANADGFDHVRSLGDNIFAFEDLEDGGDLSYDDFIFQVNLETVS